MLYRSKWRAGEEPKELGFFVDRYGDAKPFSVAGDDERLKEKVMAMSELLAAIVETLPHENKASIADFLNIEPVE